MASRSQHAGIALESVVQGLGDIIVRFDVRQIITSVDISNPQLVGYVDPDWVGRLFSETLSVASRPVADGCLKSLLSARATVARQDLTHAMPDGTELVIDYTFVADPATDGVLAIGRDLSAEVELRQQLLNAQQVIEQDYWRIRQIESRYRLLFDLSTDAALIIESGSNRILEANRRALAWLSPSGSSVVGRAVDTLFARDSAGDLLAVLGVAANQGKTQQDGLLLAGDAEPVRVQVDLLKQGAETRYLIRLHPLDQTRPAAGIMNSPQPMATLLANSPEAAVLCSGDGMILDANDAFMRLAELPGRDGVIAKPADTWIGASSIDLSILLTNTEQRGSVSMFTTVLRGQLGSRTDVEITASLVDDTGSVLLLMRDLGRRITRAAPSVAGLSREVEQLRQRVGRLPLKELVRESTDVIEAMCIERALELTDDNRAAAAELLGLSRQSLYSKMRRFQIGGLALSDAD